MIRVYFFDISVFIVILIICVTIFFRKKYSYWKNKNIPYLKPQFPFGTSENLFNRKRHHGISIQEQYHYFKNLGYKYGGLYSVVRPTLLLIDTEYIKHVISKDFNYFTDRGMYHNEKHDPLSGNLFNVDGQKWRNLRAKLTPTFTTGKIKAMFPTLVACGNPLQLAITEYSKNQKPIDIKDISARYTTDVIGSCAFGLECNSFGETEADFRKYGKLFFLPPSKLLLCKFLLINLNKSLSQLLGITTTAPKLQKFFLKTVQETVNYREKNNVVRNDFLQLLINLKNEHKSDNNSVIQQIAAQAFIFFLAGFETSSTTMTYCLYELAQNYDIQNKVRNEMNNILAKYHGKITYDAIMEMKYLGHVIDETLRKYPPLPVLTRTCVQNYQIPNTEITIDKGTRIAIPAYALQHDPEYFPNPEKFDPERFSDKNKANIVPFSYLPFGEGPRNCIGLRFGLLQTKVGLIILLKNFMYTVSSKTKCPIEFHKSSFVLTPSSEVWLDIEEISKPII